MNNSSANKDEITRKKWILLVKKQKESGLSIAEFSRQNNLTYSQMVYWASRKKSSKLPAKKPVAAASAQDCSFVELPIPQHHIDSVPNKTLRIITSYGYIIEVPL
jgi:hypothetical protein